MSSLPPERRWNPPPFDADNVLTAIQVMGGVQPPGERVLVMGGGVIGCETAVYLAQQGKQVDLCARMDADDLDMDTIDHNNRFMLLKIIQETPAITVHRGTIPVRLDNGGVEVEQKGEKKKMLMDSLVFAGPLFPKNQLGKSLENTANVFSIGDCTEPSTIMEAVWAAFKTVRELKG